uniref:Uncharacterized protein n=1 Tax=Siphoviridae sp. ctCVD13 TaxID=2826194 RepID=A0A8S5MFE5_9CAUD|nr:MAG TPA: hypothetical protein [Siphoviridae sp. ctCVD13]
MGLGVCVSVVYLSSLVGGAWPDISRCGLWCWNCNNDSANSNINNGARPLILCGTWCV